MDPVAADHDAAYRKRDFPIYLGARFLAEVAALAQSVAVGWTVYRLSNAPLALGIVGLAPSSQALPLH